MQDKEFKITQEDIKVKSGCIYAVFTDKIWLRDWTMTDSSIAELNSLISLLLECRIFNSSEEYRLMRTDLGRDFKKRYQNDKESSIDYFDEFQYLDIDESVSKDLGKIDGRKIIQATGGGRYELPLEKWKNARICIRNYISYNEMGQAYVQDWRMVKLCPFDSDDEVIDCKVPIVRR